jgi:hypothetical protein
MAIERFASKEKSIGGKQKMTHEQLTKTGEYLKGLSDQELTELVNDLENTAFEETAPMRKAINALHGEDVGIFVLRVQELIYPLLKEVHSRWRSK